MQKVISSLIAFLFISKIVFSQKEFQNATLTLKDNTTLTGQIDYKEWRKSPKKILYKALSGQIQTFYAADLKEFTITDKSEKYISSVCNISIEPLSNSIEGLKEYDSLKEALAATTTIKDTVFLLTLVTGHVNLYSYTNGKFDDQFFIQKTGEAIKELSFREVAINNGKNKEMRELKGYIVQLKKALLDCPNMAENLESLKYKTSDLVKTIKNYNECKGYVQYEKPTNKRVNEIYALGGINKPIVNFFDLNSNFSPNLNNTITPILGIIFDAGLEREHNKRGIAFEFNYKTVKSQFYALRDNGVYKSDVNYNFDMSFLQLNVLFRNHFTTGNLRPYIKGGLGLAYINKSNNIAKEKTSFSSNITETQYLTKDYELNLIAALGIQKNKFFLETRFGLGLDVSPFINYKIQINYLNLLLGYSLWQKKA